MLLWEEAEDLELRDQTFRNLWGRDASCLGGGLILSPASWESDLGDPPVRVGHKTGVVSPVDAANEECYTMAGPRQVQRGHRPGKKAKVNWPVVVCHPDTP